MVHHRYSSYLLRQVHREFDVLKQENLVTQLLPEFGEAFLNCARACIQIGDSKRALDFIERAQHAGPRYLDPTRFEFMLLQERSQAMEGIGNLDEARRQLQRCLELAHTGELRRDVTLVPTLERIIRDKKRSESFALLALLRKKSFVPHLLYQIQSPDLSINLPLEWKIDREGAMGDESKFIIQVIFSSQVRWDSASKSPIDASIDFTCSSNDEEMSLNAESLGVRHFGRLNQIWPGDLEWFLDMDSALLGKDVLCVWKFHTKRQWPKEGISIAAALPKARVHLNLMCEQAGAQMFRTELEAVGKNFTDQIVRHLKFKA
jgi:tetratricopeptide (TPR) repeat protein